MGKVKYPNYYLYPPEEFLPLAEFNEEEEEMEKKELKGTAKLLEDLLVAAENLVEANHTGNSESFRKAMNYLEMTISHVRDLQKSVHFLMEDDPKPVVSERELIPIKETIVNYKLISVYNPNELERIVNESLSSKWIPLGGVSVAFVHEVNGECYMQFTQAMVLYV